jgi:putative transposase
MLLFASATPDDGEHLYIRYRNLARPPMSLWELQAARRRLAAEGAAHVDEEALFEARRRNIELVTRAKSETRRQRRDGERRARGYAAALAPAPPQRELEPAAPIAHYRQNRGD